MTTLELLIAKRIPFAVVFCNGILGSSVVYVITDKDNRAEPMLTGFESCDSKRYLFERELTPAQITEFNRIKTDEDWQSIDLGEAGKAYQLIHRPFKPYYNQLVKQRRDEEKKRLELGFKTPSKYD